MYDNETVDDYFNRLAKIMSGGGYYDVWYDGPNRYFWCRWNR
jgi:hypothetical protein